MFQNFFLLRKRLWTSDIILKNVIIKIHWPNYREKKISTT